ncbi:hypothetical protein GDO86_015836 [Hymenochirus boettgeri]|uniref:A to I editase domain-containing protein n=1 Tax=Hymenochirus boettgeri TaxID=247094 RepID=A0A8T2K2P0_9PIPI|nr:hypothetical protein GDO86_015836 [Hymenochirus boettgeri]KAG8448912.1 hypothetical protein GDO86_015836 [Hymenochirus boettgeri]
MDTDEGPNDCRSKTQNSAILQMKRPQQPGILTLTAGSIKEEGTERIEGNEAELILRHEQICAAMVSNTFQLLMKDPDYINHKSIMAAFILEREVNSKSGKFDKYEVVAIGTGNSCYQGWQEYNGLLVHDSHALVVARRSLLRYLYKQLNLHYSGLSQAKEKCIFCHSEKTQMLVLKPGIFLHLYLNALPEGCTQVNPPWAHATPFISLHVHAKGSLLSLSECPPCFLASRVYCLSALDKIMKWNVLGIQGALLSQIIDPIYIISIVTGPQEKQSLHHALSEKRKLSLDLSLFPSYYMHTPYILCGSSIFTNKTPVKHSNHSLNWCRGDSHVEIVDGAKGKTVDCSAAQFPISRLCKAAMLMCYWRLKNANGKSPGPISYSQSKSSSDQYQQVKTLFHTQFCAPGQGSWPHKLCVDKFEMLPKGFPDRDAGLFFQCDLHS